MFSRYRALKKFMVKHFFLSISVISFYAMQIISAISGGITDLSFNTVGYGWQIANCVLTASYSVCKLKILSNFR